MEENRIVWGAGNLDSSHFFVIKSLCDLGEEDSSSLWISVSPTAI